MVEQEPPAPSGSSCIAVAVAAVLSMKLPSSRNPSPCPTLPSVAMALKFTICDAAVVRIVQFRTIPFFGLSQ